MTDQPLHDFIDMEAYDVVAGQTYRDLLAAHERVKAERDAGGRELVRLIPQLDRALAALREIAYTDWASERHLVRRAARAAIAEIEGEAT